MKLKTSQKLSLSAMIAALTVLMLYAAYALPTIKLACVFVSSIFIYVLLVERAYGYAVMTFFASSLLALFIVPDRLYFGLYLVIAGHYGIFKQVIDSKLRSKVIGACLKVIYCNAFMAIGLMLILFVFRIDIPTEQLPIPVWLLVAFAEVGFIIMDILHSVCRKFYMDRIRSALLSSRGA